MSCVRLCPDFGYTLWQFVIMLFGDQWAFWSSCNLCLAISSDMLELFTLEVQFDAWSCTCRSKMCCKPYSNLLYKTLLGIVFASPTLCLKVFPMLDISWLQHCSNRIMSFKKYSILGISTWLIMYRACLSVILFIPIKLLVRLILFLINSVW